MLLSEWTRLAGSTSDLLSAVRFAELSEGAGMSASGWMRLSVLSMSLCSCMSVVGCSDGSAARHSTTERVRTSTTIAASSVNTLDCASPIDTLAAPPSEYRAALGAVALDTTTHKTPSTTDDGDGRHYFVKTGILVRAGLKARISVVSPARGAEMGWGNTGDLGAARQIVIDGCHPPNMSPKSKWLVFPGGFTLARPACVELKVTSGGRSATMKVPAGAAC